MAEYDLTTIEGLVGGLEDRYSRLYQEDTQINEDESYLMKLSEWADKRTSQEPVIEVTDASGSRGFKAKDLVTEVIIGSDIGKDLISTSRILSRAEKSIKYAAYHFSLCIMKATCLFISHAEVPFEDKRRVYDHCYETFQCLDNEELEPLLRKCQDAKVFFQLKSRATSYGLWQDLSFFYEFLSRSMAEKFQPKQH